MNKHILFIAGDTRTLVDNRGDLIVALKKRRYRVSAVVPEYDLLPHIKDLEIEWHTISLQRTGINPFSDIRANFKLNKIIDQCRPDIVFSYTIKPVIYGSLIASWNKVPVRVSMITGVGYLFTGKSIRQKLIKSFTRLLYKQAMNKNHLLFFQNPDDMELFKKEKLISRNDKRAEVTDGSGVNLEHFTFKNPPAGNIVFLLVARMLEEKGIYEFVRAAVMIKRAYPEVICRIVGPQDKLHPRAIPEEVLNEWANEGIVELKGEVRDIRPELEDASVMVLPSYREGTPRSVLEAMATGRPVITTNSPGCRETVKNGITGYLVKTRDWKDIYDKMNSFIQNPQLIPEMGKEARKYAEERYDVNKVNAQIIAGIECVISDQVIS